MQASHSSLELSTEIKKGKPRKQPVWIGRYIIGGKDSRKVLGPAWLKRSQPAEGFLDRDKAEMALNAHLRALGAQIEAEKGIPFGTVTDAYLATLRFRIHAGTFKASTFETYRFIIMQRLIPMWGDTAFECITADVLRTYRNQLVRAKVSATTLNQYRAVINGIFTVGQDQYGLAPMPENVWPYITNKRNRSGEIQHYTFDQILRLVEHTKEEQDKVLFFTAALTGLRAGELRALRWSAIEWEDGWINVTRSHTDEFETDDGEILGGEDLPKNYTIRHVPLAETVATRLKSLRERQRFTSDDDHVFVGIYGEPLDHSALTKRYRKAQRAAGLPRIRFHDLRHTFGTLMIQEATIVELQEWMGHADIQTTRGYLHYVKRPEAAKAFNDLLARLSNGATT